MDDAALRAVLDCAFAASKATGSNQQRSDSADSALLEEALPLAVGQAASQARSPQTGQQGGATLAIVVERLADDVKRAPILDELVALAGTSRYTLVRQFGRRHGLPPMTWLLQLRLHRARERIAAGWGLAEIGLSCGFSDQNHLTRLFTR